MRMWVNNVSEKLYDTMWLKSRDWNKMFTHCLRKSMKKAANLTLTAWFLIVDQPGLEPGTSRLWVCCSNQLSYKSKKSKSGGNTRLGGKEGKCGHRALHFRFCAAKVHKKIGTHKRKTYFFWKTRRFFALLASNRQFYELRAVKPHSRKSTQTHRHDRKIAPQG